MKKILSIVLLLCVVSMTGFAKDSKKAEVKKINTPEAAAKASHEILKDKINKDKKIDSKCLKKIRQENGLTNKSEITFNYDAVSTTKAENAVSNSKRKKAKEEEALKFDFEGNLKIKESTSKGEYKYVAKGQFSVKGKEGNYKTVTPKLTPDMLASVPYFEREAQVKAKSLVEAYYKQHKEFTKHQIQKVEACEEGYQVTTTSTFKRDEYTGNNRAMIFFVQKDAEKLEAFQLLEDKIMVKDLVEYDNTPEIKEPVTPEDDATDNTGNESVTGDIEQLVINGFSLNSFALSDENKAQLDNAAQILMSDKNMEIELLGHSCDLGDKEVNYTFGIIRAKEAKQYLVSKGVEANRIYVHSYGEKKPLVPNTSAENRAKNRRVEIKVIK